MALTHAGAPLGRILGGNVGYGHGEASATKMSPVAPTLARGVDQVSDLNARLSDLHGRVAQLADTIGGPRPVAGECGDDRVPPSGIVDRLHDSVNVAHGRVTDINELLDTIGRQLG